jgi:hypothetical protein
VHCLLKFLEWDQEPLSQPNDVLGLSQRVIVLLLVELDLLELDAFFRAFAGPFNMVVRLGRGCGQFWRQAICLGGFVV